MWTLWPWWETRQIEIHEDSLLIRKLTAGVYILEYEIPFDTADLSITGDTIDMYLDNTNELVEIDKELVWKIDIKFVENLNIM